MIFSKIFTQKEIERFQKEKALLLVSGGPDSVFLFHLFLYFQKKYGFLFEVLHVNHHERGEESDEEEEFVKKICENNGILCHTRDFFSSHKKNFQQEAREARKSFCFELSQTQNFIVVTAHHEDDQMETLCMRKSRGTGIKGMSGMRRWQEFFYEKKHLYFFHPLLGFSKKTILKFLEGKNISYKKDSSNDSLKYYRNRVRKIVDSEKEKGEIFSLVKTLGAVDDYFTSRLRCYLEKDFFSLSKVISDSWPEEMQFRFFSHMMAKCGYQKQIERKHFRLFRHTQEKIVLDYASCSRDEHGWHFSNH